MRAAFFRDLGTSRGSNLNTSSTISGNVKLVYTVYTFPRLKMNEGNFARKSQLRFSRSTATFESLYSRVALWGNSCNGLVNSLTEHARKTTKWRHSYAVMQAELQVEDVSSSCELRTQDRPACANSAVGAIKWLRVLPRIWLLSTESIRKINC